MMRTPAVATAAYHAALRVTLRIVSALSSRRSEISASRSFLDGLRRWEPPRRSTRCGTCELLPERRSDPIQRPGRVIVMGATPPAGTATHPPELHPLANR